ncbi:MAG: serine/threonine protein kinase PknE [Sandaracinaceae bacterium]
MVAAGDMVAEHYRIESVIAEGGARNKYLATDERRWRKVVLETVPAKLAGSDATVFANAMEAAAGVRHPTLAEVFESGLDPAVGPWLAAAPMEGEPLEARLAQQPLPASELIPLAKEMLAALGAVHNAGLQHLGVRPSEVFLEAGLDGTRPRLLGLGLGLGLDAQHTPDAALPWIAPEHASGEATDARTDVYGVGALMYGALTGSAPYQAGTLGELVRTMYTSGPTPLASRAPSTPPALAALIDRCLAVDPNARPGSAAELVSLLDGLDAATSGTARTVALHASQLPSMAGAAAGAAPGWHPAPNQAPLIGGAPASAAPAAAPSAPIPVAAAPKSSSGSNTVLWVVGLLVALGGLTVLGVLALFMVGGFASYFLASNEYTEPVEVYEPPVNDAPSVLAPPDDLERAFLPVDSTMPSRGPADAPVTVVMFSDFQCPFCSRVEPTITRLLNTYPNDVRVVWRDHPLPFHNNAMPAAELAREAFAQGGDARFWQAHDLLFANTRQLDRLNLERFGGQLGLEPNRVRAALDSHTHRAHVEADARAAQALGARGTPSFFINGRVLSGAQPYERFDAMVNEELATARTAMGQGITRGQMYSYLTANGRRGPPSGEAEPEQPARRQPDPNAIYRVPVGNSPAEGPSDALVTIVVFSEFQCPFCNRVRPTLDQVQERYGRDVRIVFKHNPLPFHSDAMPAAEAASEVYARRGSEAFFRYHDRLFENQRELTRDNLIAWAREENVAVGPALDDHRHRSAIEADQTLARSLGASGTPSFFINGRNLRGAQPFPAFQSVIDEELVRARAELARGTSRQGLYAALIRNGATTPQFTGDAPTPAPSPSRPENGQHYEIAVPRNAPSQGPASAPVTIQLFSDFQCPFCSRLGPTIRQIRERYPTQVRIVWRHYPLPFHQNAMPAAEAATEVYRQGGDRAFWAYHDLLFENQRELTRPNLERFAGQVGGINMQQFRAALDNHTHRAAVQADMSAVTDAGARIGTPSSFVNGNLLQGAQPFPAFQSAIDAQLNR